MGKGRDELGRNAAAVAGAVAAALLGGFLKHQNTVSTQNYNTDIDNQIQATQLANEQLKSGLLGSILNKDAIEENNRKMAMLHQKKK